MDASHLFCEHQVNAKSCLKCFHKPKPKAPAASAMPKALNPTQARINAIVSGARASAQQSDAVPAGAQVVPNAATQVPQIQNIPAPHVQRPKQAKSIDDPIPQRAGAGPTGGFTYDSRTAPIPYGDRPWEPPPRQGKERREIIDQLPSHPQPNGGR